MRSQKLNEAFPKITGLLEILPQDPTLYDLLGICYFHKQMFQKAQKAYEKAYQLNPRNQDYLIKAKKCEREHRLQE